MLSRIMVRRLVFGLMLLALAHPAWADQDERPRRSFSSLINVDALLDNYMLFVSRKYNLTDEQDTVTEQLVRSRVDDFLVRHHDELSSLVDRLVDVRTGGDISPAELAEWGRRMRPIYDEAKLIIIDANDEWRAILTEEQRAIHDQDVQLMYQSFTTTEDQLNRLATGAMTVDEFRNPRRVRAERQPTVRAAPPQVAQGAPRSVAVPRTAGDAASVGELIRSRSQASQDAGAGVGPSPVRPQRTRGDAADAPRTGGNPRAAARSRAAGPDTGDPAGKWEQYVRDFIDRYQLDADQQGRAYRVLRNCQDQAERMLRSRQPTIDRLDRQAEGLRGQNDQASRQQLEKITAKRARLVEPLDAIFEKQLKPRLEQIPTRAQREAAEKAGKAGGAARVGQRATSDKTSRQPPIVEPPVPPEDDPEDPGYDPEPEEPPDNED